MSLIRTLLSPTSRVSNNPLPSLIVEPDGGAWNLENKEKNNFLGFNAGSKTPCTNKRKGGEKMN